MFLKISNCLKTCPTRFPGARSASLHPELPQGLVKVNSYSSNLESPLDSKAIKPVNPKGNQS